MRNPVIYQVAPLLSRNKISFDKEELSFQIQTHPSYPSLYAFTGIFDYFNITNLALDVPSHKRVLEQPPATFLAQFNKNQEKDFTIVSKKRDKITVHFSVENKKIYSKEEFLTDFTGILIAVKRRLSRKLLKKRIYLYGERAYLEC